MRREQEGKDVEVSSKKQDPIHKEAFTRQTDILFANLGIQLIICSEPSPLQSP